MYKCVHCKQEASICNCAKPYRTPSIPHDWPGQPRIYRGFDFRLPELVDDSIRQFLEMCRRRVVSAMALPSMLFIKSDRPSSGYAPRWQQSKTEDVVDARRRAFFFMDTGKEVAYKRTKTK